MKKFKSFKQEKQFFIEMGKQDHKKGVPHNTCMSKAFLNHIYNSTGLDTEGALVLDQVEQDMINAGFDYDELEVVENEFLSNM